jgi:hypothetical protein
MMDFAAFIGGSLNGMNSDFAIAGQLQLVGTFRQS